MYIYIYIYTHNAIYYNTIKWDHSRRGQHHGRLPLVYMCMYMYTCHILPPSEIDLGLLWADFTDLERKHLFPPGHDHISIVVIIAIRLIVIVAIRVIVIIAIKLMVVIIAIILIIIPPPGIYVYVYMYTYM